MLRAGIRSFLGTCREGTVVPLDDDVLALAAHYLFSERRRAAEIKDLLQNHKITINNSDTYNVIIPAIIEKGWLHFKAPWNTNLSLQLRKTFHLQQVQVTRTNYLDDVASRAAFMVLDLLRSKAKRQIVRVGFSGGHTTRKVFQRLALLLAEPSQTLPERIVFHALVAGFDFEAPGADPTSFFTYLAERQTRFGFLLLHAPPVVQPGKLQALLSLPGVDKAYQGAKNLDLIVTSAAVFSDDHSQLGKYYRDNDRTTYERLKQEGCIGDMLWLPVNDTRPMDLSGYDYRPVTLLELDDLPARVQNHTKVLLVIGPCADPSHSNCQGRKTAILRAIINLNLKDKNRKYITHLVVDNATAEELVQPHFAAAAGTTA